MLSNDGMFVFLYLHQRVEEHMHNLKRMNLNTTPHVHDAQIISSKFRVYLGVRTCELFLCFVPFVFLGFVVVTSLFSLFYVTGEFNRFLHRG